VAHELSERERTLQQRGIRGKLYRHPTAVFSVVRMPGQPARRATSSGSQCRVSYTPRPLPAALRVASPSSVDPKGHPYPSPCATCLAVFHGLLFPSLSVTSPLKTILAPCSSLLTSCYLPSATQDLFFLSGCQWRLRCWMPFHQGLARSQRRACTVKLERCLPLP
jgi:hypothetical protein